MSFILIKRAATQVNPTVPLGLNEGNEGVVAARRF